MGQHGTPGAARIAGGGRRKPRGCPHVQGTTCRDLESSQVTKLSHSVLAGQHALSSPSSSPQRSGPSNGAWPEGQAALLAVMPMTAQAAPMREQLQRGSEVLPTAGWAAQGYGLAPQMDASLPRGSAFPSDPQDPSPIRATSEAPATRLSWEPAVQESKGARPPPAPRLPGHSPRLRLPLGLAAQRLCGSSSFTHRQQPACSGQNLRGVKGDQTARVAGPQLRGSQELQGAGFRLARLARGFWSDLGPHPRPV